MNCRDFREALSERLGALVLDSAEEEHAAGCHACRTYCEDLKQLEGQLETASFAPLTDTEFAVLQEKLDGRIAQYIDRAFGAYRLMARYGTSLAAVFLVLFISIFSGLNHSVKQAEQGGTVTSQSYISTETGDEETLSDSYFSMAVNDYVQKYGLNTGDMIIGDISEEEFDYLKNNLDIGGIL